MDGAWETCERRCCQAAQVLQKGNCKWEVTWRLVLDTERSSTTFVWPDDNAAYQAFVFVPLVSLHQRKDAVNTRLSGPRGQSLVPASIRTPDRPAPCLITIPILSLMPVNINNHENLTAAAAVAVDNVLPQRYKPHAE